MKNTLRLAITLSIATIGLSTPAHAQSVFEKCIQQIAEEDFEGAKKSADFIKRARGINSSNIESAEVCVSTVLGQPYVFSIDDGKLVPAIELTRRQNLKDATKKLEDARLAEEQRLQRNIAAAARLTVTTCNKLYRWDTEAAIVNSVCNDLFMKIGLPE